MVRVGGWVFVSVIAVPPWCCVESIEARAIDHVFVAFGRITGTKPHRLTQEHQLTELAPLGRFAARRQMHQIRMVKM